MLPESSVDWKAPLEGLARALWEECNLRGEAEHQTKFSENMESVPCVFVPRVADIIISEWVHGGVPLRVIPSDVYRPREAHTLVRDVYYRSMFVKVFFLPTIMLEIYTATRQSERIAVHALMMVTSVFLIVD